MVYDYVNNVILLLVILEHFLEYFSYFISSILVFKPLLQHLFTPNMFLVTLFFIGFIYI
jgi:hypothetical protein